MLKVMTCASLYLLLIVMRGKPNVVEIALKSMIMLGTKLYLCGIMAESSLNRMQEPDGKTMWQTWQEPRVGISCRTGMCCYWMRFRYVRRLVQNILLLVE